MEFKRSWTETDVKALIGQSESIRREFKAGDMFDSKPESEWIKTLSKAVSAFANTEGGELIVGVQEEKRAKMSFASGIDGIPTTVSRERLLDLIQGNLSPHLPGIGLEYIKLSALPDRVVVVIQVPQGSTAYQAKDRLYYGRSEFKAEALPDNEVRLRMMRGEVAQAQLDAVQCEYRAAEDEFQDRVQKADEAGRTFAALEKAERPIRDWDKIRAKATAEFEDAKQALERGKNEFDEYSFLLQLMNVGGITIRDFLCVIRNVDCDSLFISDGERALAIGSEISTRFAEARVTEVRGDRSDPSHHTQTHRESPEKKLFPRESTVLPVGRWLLRVPHVKGGDSITYSLAWTVFLDDAPPSTGIIRL
jgi:hypothetical protein